MLKGKTLFVASEDPAAVRRFRRYQPITAHDVGLAGTFTDDWRMLRQCDIILMPNSTFSFTAAMANPHLKQTWRASLPEGRFVQIDPWNTTPLLYERAENYRHHLGRIAKWTWYLGLRRAAQRSGEVGWAAGTMSGTMYSWSWSRVPPEDSVRTQAQLRRRRQT